MLSLIRYIFGYVKIKIVSEKPEMLLNKLISCGISVWNTERSKDGIELCLSAKNFLKIRDVRKEVKSRSKVRIIKKFGLKKDIQRYNFRKGIVVGLSLVLIINLCLSCFIWVVDISGEKVIDKYEILKVCENIGIRKGSFKHAVDTYNASQEIALMFDRIAWVSVNIEGSKLTVNISESNNDSAQNEIASNIVAQKDGVIKSVKDISGTKCVEVGHTVKKGDILISGVETVGNTVRYVFSKGEVLAETQHKFTKKIYKNIGLSVFDGKTIQRTVFEFFGIGIPLYLNGVNKTEKSFLENKNFYVNKVEMPVSLITRTFYVYENRSVTVDFKSAKDLAVSQIINEIMNYKINEILDYNFVFNEEENYYCFEINIRCIEDIGITDNISIPND